VNSLSKEKQASSQGGTGIGCQVTICMLLIADENLYREKQAVEKYLIIQPNEN